MEHKKRWEHFEHGADIGVRGYGRSLDEAFSQAALALTAVVTDLESVSARDQVHIQCDAPDAELLLTDWLNAIIYEMAVRKMLFSRFDVEIHDNKLQAVIWGETVNVQKHKPAVEIKGATYTALDVARDERDTWHAQCVVDV